MSLNKILPGFKATCLIAGVLDILMACSMLIPGVTNRMAEFGIPEETLASPHYYDAMF